VFSFTPRPLYPRGKSPRYPLDRKLGVPQSLSGRRGEEKILDSTGTRTPTFGRPAHSQSLSRLTVVGIYCMYKMVIRFNVLALNEDRIGDRACTLL
jgi:hypothetical protein